MADIFSKIAKDEQVKKQLRNNGAKSPVIGAAVRVGAWDKIAEKIANKNESVAAKMKARVLAELAENKKNTVKQTVVPAKTGVVGFGSFSVTKKSTTSKSLPTQLEEMGAEVEIKSATLPVDDGRIEIEQDIEAAKPDGLTTQLEEVGAEVEIKSAVPSTDAPEEEEVQTAAVKEGGRTVGVGQVTEIVE